MVPPGPLLAPGPGLGWTPAHAGGCVLTAPQLHQSNVDENLVNNQIRRNKGILFEPNRIMALETASRRYETCWKLKTQLCAFLGWRVTQERGTLVVHTQFTGTHSPGRPVDKASSLKSPGPLLGLRKTLLL